jgi:hypothetical protein
VSLGGLHAPHGDSFTSSTCAISGGAYSCGTNGVTRTPGTYTFAHAYGLITMSGTKLLARNDPYTTISCSASSATCSTSARASAATGIPRSVAVGKAYNPYVGESDSYMWFATGNTLAPSLFTMQFSHGTTTNPTTCSGTSLTGSAKKPLCPLDASLNGAASGGGVGLGTSGLCFATDSGASFFDQRLLSVWPKSSGALRYWGDGVMGKYRNVPYTVYSSSLAPSAALGKSMALDFTTCALSSVYDPILYPTLALTAATSPLTSAPIECESASVGFNDGSKIGAATTASAMRNCAAYMPSSTANTARSAVFWAQYGASSGAAVQRSRYSNNFWTSPESLWTTSGYTAADLNVLSVALDGAKMVLYAVTRTALFLSANPLDLAVMVQWTRAYSNADGARELRGVAVVPSCGGEGALASTPADTSSGTAPAGAAPWGSVTPSPSPSPTVGPPTPSASLAPAPFTAGNFLVSRVQQVTAAEVNEYGVPTSSVAASDTLALGRVWIDEYSFDSATMAATHVRSFHFPYRAQDLTVANGALSLSTTPTTLGYTPTLNVGPTAKGVFDQLQFQDQLLSVSNMHDQVLTLPWDDSIAGYNALGQISISSDRCAVSIGGLGVPIEDVKCAISGACTTSDLFTGTFSGGTAAAVATGGRSALSYGSSGYPVSMARFTFVGWDQDKYAHWLPFTTGTISSSVASTPTTLDTLITYKFPTSGAEAECGTGAPTSVTGYASVVAPLNNCDYYKPNAVRATNLAQVPRAVALGYSGYKLTHATATYIDGRTDTTGQISSNTGTAGGMWSRCWSGQTFSRNSAMQVIGQTSLCPYQDFKAVDPGNAAGNMGLCQIGSSSGDLHMLEVRRAASHAAHTHTFACQPLLPLPFLPPYPPFSHPRRYAHRILPPSSRTQRSAAHKASSLNCSAPRTLHPTFPPPSALDRKGLTRPPAPAQRRARCAAARASRPPPPPSSPARTCFGWTAARIPATRCSAPSTRPLGVPRCPCGPTPRTATPTSMSAASLSSRLISMARAPSRTTWRPPPWTRARGCLWSRAAPPPPAPFLRQVTPAWTWPSRPSPSIR